MKNLNLILFICLILAGTSSADEFTLNLSNDSGGSEICEINATEPCGDENVSNITIPDTTSVNDTKSEGVQECRTYNVGNCGGIIRVLYFYKTDCPNCEKVKPLIEELELKYNLNITKINAAEDPDTCIQCAACHNVSASVPMIVLSHYALVGRTEINDGFEEIIKICQDNQNCECILVPDTDLNPPEKPTLGALLIAMIIGAAIADALNVCALGVLIFLIASVLSKTHRDHKEALKVGLSFIAGIYIMYFLTGVGMFHVLKEVVVATGTIWLFKKIIGTFALLVGILNLKDYLSYGSLGFTMEIPTSWNKTTTRILKGVTSIRGAFLAGLIISFFLAPCAVTIYASVVGMMATMDIPFILAVLILAIYNLAFVLPMIIVVLMVYFGFKRTGGMEMWRQRNKRRMHLFTGIIMCILGLVLIAGLL